MAGSYIGAWKQAARRAGLSLDEFLTRKDGGERWCVGHKALHSASEFGADGNRADGIAATCRIFRRKRERALYVPKPGPHRFGPPPHPPRDGDKKQARQRVNVLVRTGRLPHPNTLPCTDCDHLSNDRRHEYDHHLGYSPGHHLDVQPVCTKCHARRAVLRGETKARRRRPAGVFASGVPA